MGHLKAQWMLDAQQDFGVGKFYFNQGTVCVCSVWFAQCNCLVCSIWTKLKNTTCVVTLTFDILYIVLFTTLPLTSSLTTLTLVIHGF